MKTSISAIAAMMMAASFAGSALAEGDYYNGASKAQATSQVSTKVDGVNTGSIDQVRANGEGQPIFGRTNRDNR